MKKYYIVNSKAYLNLINDEFKKHSHPISDLPGYYAVECEYYDAIYD